MVNSLIALLHIQIIAIALLATVFIASAAFATFQISYAQQIPGSFEELVTYEKDSSFIREYPLDVEQPGLRGVTTDSEGNVWAIYSTNKTTTIIRLEPQSGKLTEYHVGGDTQADDAVINLAAGQLTFDRLRNVVWFTDARTNSIGKLDLANNKVDLLQIPNGMAGPMGLALSQDNASLWFTEITGDKIGRVDIESLKITEYLVGQDSGPTLLTFDDKGILWVTLSFSNSILRVDTQALTSGQSSAMTELRLLGEDTFSPFGIAVVDDKVYISDHGSSRIVVADTGFANHQSYWTTPAVAFPASLPSQVVADKYGNIYFPQHGGNRISMIDNATGVMTEYEIPTGPLATAVFIAASDDGKVWFTEWAANKIAYLDTTAKAPFTIGVEKTTVTLDTDTPQSIGVSLNSSVGGTDSVSILQVEIGLTGMTESGLKGVTYEAQPPRVNLQQTGSAESQIQISTLENAIPGDYVAMVRAFAPEQDGLVVSKLYPVELVLDVPEPIASQDSNQPQNADTTLQNALRIGAPLAAAGLIAVAIYRWKRARKS
ncbi:putative virginiamycin B lyase [Candidatus Nitrososphaera gargensis Ga9.2]|uniref:Putative virginiamycin B lyase n=1 Tax=Nitrososphaera gargensis (strain Ga9.2) TaxID=1237085 RepID=K0ID93_NITGG|nr:SMP-30/gluconolactonase/LRE family protein [Candidatus Nitrososphaera gargensis]AFU57630.1 putative virginiamycin B lyase [Candidatus Nitrososphaera gargensis Ga9.2]